jgi:XTP/dITP diphosphohydrolase
MIGDLRGQDLLVASGNAGKLAEFTALLAPFGNRVLSLKDLGLSEPEETEFTFAGNARLKARAAVAASGLPSLADDSGLMVDILGGWPGIYTADWAEGSDGRDFDVAMTKTWDMLRAIRAKPPYLALFHCVLVLSFPSGKDLVFNGRLLGQIVWPKRGSLGHGYDPIFQPDGHQKTMGEMSGLEKNRISHRAKAVQSLADHCFT